MTSLDLEQYNYDLPETLIRKQGVEPRDSARLFVYDTATDSITHARFSELARFLPEQSMLVLNNTKVVPARLWLKKPAGPARNTARQSVVGGGKIEVFVLVNEMWPVIASEAKQSQDGGGLPRSPRRTRNDDSLREIPILVDRKCEVGWHLLFPNDDSFEIIRQEANKFFAILHSEQGLETLLQQFGETPIPHYLEEDARDEVSLRKRYQTIFAHEGASVAAPTASLHFTDGVFVSLAAKHIGRTEVTLNVGLGTFAPLRDEHFETGKLHREYVEVTPEAAEAINQAKRSRRKIIPVGTTALRTLESVGRDGTLKACAGETDIFIYPPYQFRIADSLITNFHLPKSSLMLLVDAFLQDKKAQRGIVELYQEAIREGYAFYSFGDSMLIM
jgi:S-adenosylmethionine:tRNA ribosyltransferase-isomerase